MLSFREHPFLIRKRSCLFCGKVDLMGVEPISEHRPLIFVITIITISICFFLVKISDRFLFSDIERFL